MLTIAPTFSHVPPLAPELPTSSTAELHCLKGATKGDFLGTILGHEVGWQYPGDSVSENLCTLVANGDERGAGAIADVRLLMHIEPTPDVAVQALARLRALFVFLRGINPRYRYYTLELPVPNSLFGSEDGNVSGPHHAGLENCRVPASSSCCGASSSSDPLFEAFG